MRFLQGIISISSGETPYLLVISEREKVASLGGGGDIYVITGVVAIPLASRKAANDAITKAKATASERSAQSAAYESDHEDAVDGLPSPTNPEGQGEMPDGADTLTTTNEADNLSAESGPRQGAQGDYKRFAQNWFAKKEWSLRRRDNHLGEGETGDVTTRQVGSSALDPSTESKTGQLFEKSGTGESSLDNQNVGPARMRSQSRTGTSTIGELLPKLIRTTKTLFGSRNFFFSYDYDITRRLGAQEHVEAEKAFYEIADQEYFWNRHLLRHFIDAGTNEYILPLMQGFVGQRGFQLPTSTKGRPPEASAEQDADYHLTIISRRSIKRPGLRYLRRGADEGGNVANSVETEQILSSHDKVASFVQYRGSIPLYFSQSPYSLKPVPVMQQKDEENAAALKRHFIQLEGKYGPVQAVLLVNQEGVEAPIGHKYEAAVQECNHAQKLASLQTVGFEWFDFHKECRGMKFENVSILIKQLASRLEKIGYFFLADGQERHQNGVIRTNCMDCLDRTNVVQAAFGAKALEAQLKERGAPIDLETNMNTQWFNSLWADNGDAISRQYASTAALKGDYTRTRKRDYRGALNDLGLTLTRYYNNIFGDFFTQTAIDFMLGNVDSSVFVDFEATMMSKDPAISMSKVRGNAIDTSSKIVIADQSEKLTAAWALLSPKEPNMVRSLPLEEVILLLTDIALYVVRFDWSIEKVSSFERIDLQDIKGLVRGTYITSPFTAAQMNEKSNIGIVIRYNKDTNNTQRTMSRSMSASLSKQEEGVKNKKVSPSPSWVPDLAINRFLGRSSSSTVGIVAFKALSPGESFFRVEGEEQGNKPELEQVKSVSETIARAIFADGEEKKQKFIEDQSIITLLEAQKSTGYIDYWGHSLKRLVWA